MEEVLTKTPLISIIMPVYNSAEYLKQSVESILSQSYNKFEFIIIDDGSSDNTVEIVKSYKDDRIVLYCKPHDGFINQLNFGLQICKGDFIARMDGDDISHKERLYTQVNFLLSNEDIALVSSNFYYINEIGKVIQKKKFPEFNDDIEFMMPVIPSVLHGAMLSRKKPLIDIGGYDVNYFCEDVVLFLKMLSNGYQMYNLQEYLYSYRITEKPYSYHKKHYDDFYKYSREYLDSKYKTNNLKIDDGNYFFRLGLVEYYNGKPGDSRKYFLKCFQNKKIKKLNLLRYILLSFLGNKIFNFLRGKGINKRINIFISKYFRLDTNKIINPGKKINNF